MPRHCAIAHVRSGGPRRTSLAIRHAAAPTPTISLHQTRARRCCRLGEPLCPFARPSILPAAPLAPSAAPMLVPSTTGVSAPRSLRPDAPSPPSNDRPTSHDSAGRQVCCVSHSAFCPRDCGCDVRSPIGLSATGRMPTRAIIPFAGRQSSPGAPPASPAASTILMCDSCCLTSFLMCGRRPLPTPQIAAICCA